MFESDEMKSYAIQGTIIVILIIVFILVGVFIFRKSSDNGASTAQMFIGRQIGDVCTSDSMCGTNKCRNNICIY
jgi:hypothetical protein